MTVDPRWHGGIPAPHTPPRRAIAGRDPLHHFPAAPVNVDQIRNARRAVARQLVAGRIDADELCHILDVLDIRTEPK